MPAPDTWSAYYRRAAADEAALGNDKAARTHLRYARIAEARDQSNSIRNHCEANIR